jgi:hypothetical protein
MHTFYRHSINTFLSGNDSVLTQNICLTFFGVQRMLIASLPDVVFPLALFTRSLNGVHDGKVIKAARAGSKEIICC